MNHNKGKRFPPEPLTGEEVWKLIGKCSNRSPSGIRNKALIVLMYRGMLRVSEALNLYPKDIDPEAGTVRVLHGKGDKSRVVGVDPEAMNFFLRWLDKRTTLSLNGRHRFICTLQGRPVSTNYVRNLLYQLRDKTGIEKRVHPHGLRHTGAFELANEGIPIHVISQQLGHSSIATTHRYLAHLHPEAVVQAMRERSWPCSADS